MKAPKFKNVGDNRNNWQKGKLIKILKKYEKYKQAQ